MFEFMFVLTVYIVAIDGEKDKLPALESYQ